MRSWIKYSLKPWLARKRERIIQTIAWRMPRSVVYWCSIRLMAHATQGPWSTQIVPDLTAMDALERWEKNR